MTAEYYAKERSNYKDMLSMYSILINSNTCLKGMMDAILDSAAENAVNAGYSGDHGDRGSLCIH